LELAELVAAAERIASAEPADSVRSVSQDRAGHANKAAGRRPAAHKWAVEGLVAAPAAGLAAALAAERAVALAVVPAAGRLAADPAAAAQAVAAERAVAVHPARNSPRRGTTPTLTRRFRAKLIQILLILLGGSS